MLALDRPSYIIRRDAKRPQPFIVEPDAHRALTTPDQFHGADTVEALKTFLGHIIGERRQLGDRQIASDHDGDDRRRVRIDLVHDGRIHIRRQFCQGDLHLVPNILDLLAGIGTQIELDQNLRAPFTGKGLQRFNSVDRVDVLFEDVGDFRLHGFRRGPVQRRRHIDIGKFNIGK